MSNRFGARAGRLATSRSLAARRSGHRSLVFEAEQLERGLLVLSPVWAQVLEGLAFGIHPKKEIDLARGLDYLLLQLASEQL